MPRTYKPRTRQYKKYNEDAIRLALEEYESCNLSLADISAKHNISKSVLHRHNSRFMKKQGGQPVLTSTEEAYIIENINSCSEWGYPLDTYDLRMLVKGYLDRIGVNIKKFRDNLPGPDYVKSFLRRNQDKISLRISQNIKRSRAAVSRELIEEYFNNLEKSLEGVALSNIINYDETNLSDDPGRRKVLTKRGAKYPERVMNHSKASTSLMMAASADGVLLPCYVVYKAKNLYESWIEQGPKGCRYNCTPSGWFDSNTFEDWVRTIVLSYFKDKDGKKILIGDNLSSHLSLDLIRECKEKDVHFIFLPPNSTHLTQPLDVAFFRPTKGAWRDILFLWKKTDGRTLPTIPKSIFPSLLKKLISRIQGQARSNILAGFMKTGISPLNKDRVLERLPGNNIRDEETFQKEAIDEAVITMLKEMRYGNNNIKLSNRRKKIDVKPGQSVSTETEPEESDREGDQELSSYNSESELDDSYESSQNTTEPIDTNLNKENEVRMIQPKTAKQIPEERKRKFEAKYAMNNLSQQKKTDLQFEKTEVKKRKTLLKNSTVTKQNKSKQQRPTELLKNNDKDVFKKPCEMKKYNKIKKLENKILDNNNLEKEFIEDIQFTQLLDSNELDIESMPLFFEDNFCVQEEIEITDTDLPVQLKNDQKNVETLKIQSKEKEDLVEVSKVNAKDEIYKTEHENIEKVKRYTNRNKEAVELNNTNEKDKTEQVCIENFKIHTKGNKGAVNVSNLNTKNKIIIKSVENFDHKEKLIKIDLSNMKKLALTDDVTRKSSVRNKIYYSKDEEILRDLLDNNIS